MHGSEGDVPRWEVHLRRECLGVLKGYSRRIVGEKGESSVLHLTLLGLGLVPGLQPLDRRAEFPHFPSASVCGERRVGRKCGIISYPFFVLHALKHVLSMKSMTPPGSYIGLPSTTVRRAEEIMLRTASIPTAFLDQRLDST